MEITCYDKYGRMIENIVQWDVGQSISIKGYDLTSYAPQIHFANANSEKALVVESVLSGGLLSCQVPNSLARENLPIIMYIYDAVGETGKTNTIIKIPVTPRPMPDDVVYTDDVGVISLTEVLRQAKEYMNNSLNYSTKAKESEEKAKTSADAAKVSETNAAKSENVASSSATQAAQSAKEAKAYVGSPLVANTVSAMTDQTKIYVYTGSESGYTAGNWYYHNGSAWVSGGVYNSSAVNVDKTLTQDGYAADAKVTGDAVNSLKEELVNVNQSVTTQELYQIYSSDMKDGTIDANTGVESPSSNTIISNDYIDISKVKSFTYTGITSADYYLRIVYYDANNTFISSTNGVLANKAPVEFKKPNNAKFMKIAVAYITISDISHIKPTINFSTFIDGDKINRSVKKGITKTYANDWKILEGKWAYIPKGQSLAFTPSRNSCTKNFLYAKKGNELILQNPISFTIILFSEPDDTTCFYNSYKDGKFFTGYKFESDCYFMLNFSNQTDLSAETKASDIIWTKNTVKDTQTVFIVPKPDYNVIHVASAWASDSEKLGADYVCDGVNDGEELQQAIFDLRARGGGILKLSNERYIIDTLYDSGVPSVGKFGIYIPTNNYNVSLIKIEGVNFPNVIQPMYFGHCARLDMSQDLYDSLGENEIVNMIGVKPVINKENKPSRSSVGCTLSVENVAINIPAPQKKIIGINLEYAYNAQLKGVHCGLTEYAGAPQEVNGKIINSIIDCIGIRTLYGYNWGSGYHIDDCNVRGWGLGFDISGEHLIMQNACARFVNTGYRFGHFGDDEMMSHPNTLINCCEEWLLHGMRFEGNGLGQSVNIIDFNIEDMTSNGWGRQTLATEVNKGSYRGTLTYTTTKDSYANSQQKFWADDGSGKNILTRDLNDKLNGSTSDRPKYPQNNQQYFDTTIKKMIYYIDGKWVDAMGTSV